MQAAEARANLPGSGAILFDSYGGAINRVEPAATAFVHRNVLCCIQYLSYNGGATWLNSTYAKMRPYVTGGAYFNYTDPHLKNWQTAYYGSNYQRLLSVRRDDRSAPLLQLPAGDRAVAPGGFEGRDQAAQATSGVRA